MRLARPVGVLMTDRQWQPADAGAAAGCAGAGVSTGEAINLDHIIDANAPRIEPNQTPLKETLSPARQFSYLQASRRRRDQ